MLNQSLVPSYSALYANPYGALSYGTYPGYLTRPQPYRYKRSYSKRRPRFRTAVKKVVRSIAETKFYDVIPSAEAVITYEGTMFELTDIEEGLTDISRIGNKVCGTSLQLRLRAFLPTPSQISLVPGVLLRVIVFIWKDDTEPITQDILEGSPAIGKTVYAFLNHTKKVKRKILLDTTMQLNYDNTLNSTNTLVITPGSGSSVHMEKYLPLNKLPDRLRTINFDPSEGDPTKGVNKIWMLVVADGNADTSSVGPSFYFNARYNYTDV